ncbi:MAG: citrate lyase subunit alpha, partial [Candidatus Izemoplasma sp.]
MRTSLKPVILNSLNDLYKQVDIFSNKNISFHHHLRNGDFVVNFILKKYLENKVKKINLFP